MYRKFSLLVFLSSVITLLCAGNLLAANVQEITQTENDSTRVVEVPANLIVKPTFTVSLPSRIELMPDEHDSSKMTATAVVGAKGNIDARASVNIIPSETITLYDISNRADDNTVVPSSEEDQNDYEHKDPVTTEILQDFISWKCSILQGKESSSEVSYDSDSGFYNTNIEISPAKISAGEWEGVLNFSIVYQGSATEPGLYTEDGVLTKTWEELKAMHLINVDDTGACYTNYSSNSNASSDLLDGVLIISGEVNKLADNAFRRCTMLKSVYVPKSVKSFEYSAFQDCVSLESAYLDEGLTSVLADTFYKCSKLEYVRLPKSLTVLGRETFYYCQNLRKIEIPNTVTEIGERCFNYCSRLQDIELPSSVTTIGYGAFEYCTLLKSCRIPYGVKAIEEYTFQKCSRLESVEIPSSVKVIENYAFGYCNNLKHAAIPEGVTTIDEAAFYYCEKLREIVLPSTLRSVGSYAFENCSSVTKLTIPRNLNSIGSSSFSDLYSLRSLIFEDGCTTVPKYFLGDAKAIANVELPSSMTSIPAGAFSQVANVNYTGSLEGAPWGAQTLNGCIENGLVFSDDTKTKVIGYYGDATTVIIPDGVTSINGAFNNCRYLKEITIPDSVKNIGYQSFYNCVNLKTINLPDMDYIQSLALTRVANVVYNSESYKSAIDSLCINGYVENGFVFSDETKTELCGYFGDEKNVVIPEGVITIKANAFYEHDNIESVVIPASVTTIGDRAFNFCGYLNSVEILGEVTVGDYAFYKCYSLDTINMSAVKSAGDYAFYDVPASLFK